MGTLILAVCGCGSADPPLADEPAATLTPESANTVATTLAAGSDGTGSQADQPDERTPPPADRDPMPDDGDAAPPTAPSTSTSIGQPQETAQTECRLDQGTPDVSGDEQVVRVALECGDGVFPFELGLVDRIVAGSGQPVELAVAELLQGVTPAEHEAGYSSAFSTATDGEFHSATVDQNGVVIVDLTTAFVETNNFSTSNLSRLVLGQLEATVLAFADVGGLDLRIDGRRWCGWETNCDQVPFPLIPRT